MKSGKGKGKAPLDTGARRRFQQRLLNWYRANRRNLPWRNTTDPYKILVSEIMLQ
ncbi:MAG: A/G-specific adenine glycosylase, partial [candidate division NC10 bacterium]|nr:A/G-specific adenine glycosylase [candidate division NC10 bacterium]